MNPLILMEHPPGKLPFIRSRHTTDEAAFKSVRGRKFQRLRALGWKFSVPCLAKGEEFKPEDWV